MSLKFDGGYHSCIDSLLVSAVVVEPVAGNMGMVKPVPGLFEGVRSAADGCGTLLILDEVITGFRRGPTTYGAIRGITPDLTCLGKIVGGGLPMGTVAAGLATSRILLEDDPYAKLDRLGSLLAGQLNRIGMTADRHCDAAARPAWTTPLLRGQSGYQPCHSETM